MKQLLLTVFLWPVLVTALAAQTAQSDATSDAAPEVNSSEVVTAPIAWPTAARPEVVATLRSYLYDQIPVKELWLDAAKLQAAMPVPGGWKQADKSPQESLALVNLRNKAHRLSFTYFAQDEFLSDLKDASIQGYMAGLQANLGEKLKLVNPENFRPRRAPHIFDHAWCFVDYTVTVEETTFAVRDYIVLLDECLLVIRHAGPPKVVNAYQKDLQTLLGRSYVRGEHLKAAAKSR
ncbi:MAG: hypothetical protein ACFB20_07830 [Opitutales bacterium]